MFYLYIILKDGAYNLINPIERFNGQPCWGRKSIQLERPLNMEQVSAEEFHPENYTDEVRHHMLEVIEQKVRQKKR